MSFIFYLVLLSKIQKEWKETGVFEEKGVLAVDDGEDVCWGVAMSVTLSVMRASLVWI
jgi:hypothetical protein